MPRMIQSKPVKPAGDHTRTKKIVVQGRKMNPRKAHQKLENAASHRAESMSHQMSIPNRGPINAIDANMQHTVPTPLLHGQDHVTS